MEKPGKYPGNHFNIGNIICHLDTLNIFIFWIRFASQQISYYIEMVKPETGKKPVKNRWKWVETQATIPANRKNTGFITSNEIHLNKKKVSFRLWDSKCHIIPFSKNFCMIIKFRFEQHYLSKNWKGVFHQDVTACKKRFFKRTR